MKTFFQRPWILALALGVVFPLFFQLGDRGLNEPDEGRYAEMGREMAVTGDWLTPRLNGVPHYAKPPWIYWCIAASLKAFGIHEWAARLPSALAAAVTALTVFALGCRMGGARAGALSALGLVSFVLFFVVGRLITPDMMLTACITVAFYCFWRWWDSEPRSSRWLWGFYLALAVGFLDKGLVPLGVCFLTVLGYLLAQKQIGRVRRLCLGRGLLLIALIGLPWFLILGSLNPDIYDFYLLGEVRDRLISGRGRTQPWYYHPLWLPGDCWPWTALVAGALGVHAFWWWKKDRLGPVSCFLWLWFLLPLLLFSASSSKLPTYILPIFPSLSLMLGLWIARRLEHETAEVPPWRRYGSQVLQFATWILMPAPLIGVWAATRRTLPELEPFWIKWIVIGVGVGILAWVGMLFLPRRKALRVSLALWWLGSMAILHGIVFQADRFETELRQNSSWRVLARFLEGRDGVGIPIPSDLHPSGRKPEFIRNGPRVVMYEFYFRSGSFYLMKERAEVVPLYGGNSLWEIGRDIEAEAKPTREDLIQLLKGAEQVFVFTRPQYVSELRDLTGMELPILAKAASGKYEIVLFTNRKQDGAERPQGL